MSPRCRALPIAIALGALLAYLSDSWAVRGIAIAGTVALAVFYWRECRHIP